MPTYVVVELTKRYVPTAFAVKSGNAWTAAEAVMMCFNENPLLPRRTLRGFTLNETRQLIRELRKAVRDRHATVYWAQEAKRIQARKTATR